MKSVFKVVVIGIFLSAVPALFGQATVVETKWTQYVPEPASRAIASGTLPKLPDADYAKSGVPGGGPTHPDQVQVKGTDRYVMKDTSNYYINKPGTATAPTDVFKGRPTFELGVKFMNASSKAIATIEADVVFSLAPGVEEVSYRLVTDKNIEPGKTVKFKKTISGSKAKGYSHPLTDRSVAVMRTTLPTVVVKRVVYADGTVQN